MFDLVGVMKNLVTAIMQIEKDLKELIKNEKDLKELIKVISEDGGLKK